MGTPGCSSCKAPAVTRVLVAMIEVCLGNYPTTAGVIKASDHASALQTTPIERHQKDERLTSAAPSEIISEL